jgi:uncharacterized protein
MITALLGNNSPTEGVGYKPVELCTVMTDGSVEAHDVLRIAGDGSTHTTFNIFEHAIDEVRKQSVLESHLYVSKPGGERLDMRDALAGA